MAKPFNETLATLKHGALADELGEALAGLLVECRKTMRKGKLILELEIKPGKAGQVEIFDKVTIKAPPVERDSTVLFDTPEGNLQRDDPSQKTLPGIRVVSDKDARAPIVVDRATGEVIEVNATPAVIKAINDAVAAQAVQIAPNPLDRAAEAPAAAVA